MGNRNLTFQFETKQGNYTLPQPVFTLFPTRDPVADWVGFARQVKSYAFLKNYRNAVSESRFF
jgi:soluble epoxide hydrolase / lipid-phosphate phosphatase